MTKRLTTLAITAIILVFGSVIYQHRHNANSTKSGFLIVKASPSDSTVTLDGRPIGSGQKITLSSGAQDLKISKTGFVAQEFPVNITPGRLTVIAPALQLDQKYIASGGKISLSPADATAQGGLASGKYGAQGLTVSQVDDLLRRSTDSVPIVSKLPYYGPDFSIGYGQPDPNSLQIAISIVASTAQAKQAALQWLKDNGADPSTLQIVYLNS